MVRVSRTCGIDLFSWRAPAGDAGDREPGATGIEQSGSATMCRDSFSAEPAEFLRRRSRPQPGRTGVPAGAGRARERMLCERVDALISSRLGLWHGHCSWPVPDRGSGLSRHPPDCAVHRCWPDATGSVCWACGVAGRLGTDNEFERLRDYIEGDDPRHLDWRATARRRKLTVRAHQHNQSQRIIFLIDCGRMMAGDTGGGLSPLDHAFNAMLLLAHVALLRNDQVGLLAFSDRTRALRSSRRRPRS